MPKISLIINIYKHRWGHLFSNYVFTEKKKVIECFYPCSQKKKSSELMQQLENLLVIKTLDFVAVEKRKWIPILQG